jgi:hypothetical protein
VVAGVAGAGVVVAGVAGVAAASGFFISVAAGVFATVAGASNGSPSRGISSVQSRLLGMSVTVYVTCCGLKPNIVTSRSQMPGVRSR